MTELKKGPARVIGPEDGESYWQPVPHQGHMTIKVGPGATTDVFDPYAARATAKGWLVQRLTADHNAQRSARDELCALLDRVR